MLRKLYDGEQSPLPKSGILRLRHPGPKYPGYFLLHIQGNGSYLRLYHIP